MAHERDPDDLPEFHEVVQRLREGELNDKLTHATRELMQSLLDTQRDRGGRPEGKLVLTMKYVLADGLLDVCASFTTTAPKEPITRGVFYVKPDGTLTARNPDQRSLVFGVRDATKGTPKLRDVTNT